MTYLRLRSQVCPPRSAPKVSTKGQAAVGSGKKYTPHTLAKVLLNNVLPRLVKTQALGLLKAHGFSL